MISRTYEEHRKGSLCFGAEDGKRVIKQVTHTLSLQSECGSITKKKPWEFLGGSAS